MAASLSEALHPKLRQALFALAAFLPLFAAPYPAGAQADVLGGLALGAFLNKLTDGLQQAISDARNAANGVVVESGAQAVLVVQQAQNAYQDLLDKTAGQLDQTVLTAADHLKTLSDDAIHKAGETADDVMTRGQTIANTLPFAGKEPQVNRVRPAFIVPKAQASTNEIELVFEGNFPNSSRAGFEPVLAVTGKVYQGHNETNKLTFLVPEGILFPNTASDPDKINFASIQLRLPWETPKFFGLANIRREDHFNILVGALPAVPGRISITHTTTTTTPQTKPFCSNNIHQCSDGNCGNNDDTNHEWSVPAEVGWHVVRGSSTTKVTAHGQTSGPNFVGDGGDIVRYSATTIHKAWGSSGVLDFVICFTETRDVQTPNSGTEQLVLHWGESKAYPYEAGSYVVNFADFTGKQNEWRAPEKNDNPFLTLSAQGKGISIATTDPNHVHWP